MRKMEAPKTPGAATPKSKKTMYAIVGAIVVIIIIVLALFLGGLLSLPGTSTTTANASAKIYDTGTCSSASNCGFTPTPLNIAPNTKVTWTSNSTTGHTVTECIGSSDSTYCPNKDASALSPAFDSGLSSLINNGQSYSYTFKTAGTYYYYCQIHSWMHGQVVAS